MRQLEENKIKYYLIDNLVWCDYGFPERPYTYNEEELKYHLESCRPEWNGLNDGKFYYCNVSWSAEKSGKFKLKDSDFIVLDKINPKDKNECHKIVEFSRGCSSFCKVCGGCGKDNTHYIPVGEQIKR